MCLTSVISHSFAYYVHNNYASGIQVIGFESFLAFFDKLTCVITLVLINMSAQKSMEAATAEWLIVTQIREPKSTHIIPILELVLVFILPRNPIIGLVLIVV